MGWMERVSWDWCHVCGKRSDTCVQVAYPYNAEHAKPDDPNDEGIRICSTCGALIAEVGNGRTGTIVTTKKPV